MGRVSVILYLLLFISIISFSDLNANTIETRSGDSSLFGDLPLYFVENQGRIEGGNVAYYIEGADKTLFFTSEGITFVLSNILNDEVQKWTMKLNFDNANVVEPRGEDQQKAIISYFKGSKDKWETGISTFGKLVYEDLWPGIDLVYSGTSHKLKYEFIVKPGADPSQIKMTYSGVSNLQISDNSTLLVETPFGVMEDEKPYAYQRIEENNKEVQMDYMVHDYSGEDGFSFSFTVGSYDRSFPLILDPAMIIYCGYIGGDSSEYGRAIAVDDAGYAYIVGYTGSSETTFPVKVGPYLVFSGGADAFVAKVKDDGSELEYCGYLGGPSSDCGYGVAVDSSGCAYAVGYAGHDFPTHIGPYLTFMGASDGFIAKLTPNGDGLLYSGYIGGGHQDCIYSVKVDEEDVAYVTGFAVSSQGQGFPVTVGPDLTHNGGHDAFVAKVKSDGTGLDYCGYIGGSASDEEAGYGIVFDSSKNVYIVGKTGSNETSQGFPAIVGPDLTYNGGGHDAFVAKVKSDGTGLDYCGYIGGNEWDAGYGIDINSDDEVYVTGHVCSTESTFPVTVGPDLTHNGGERDAFVAKIKSDGTGLLYCGYIGGDAWDVGTGLVIDELNNAYIIGYTLSDENTFPAKIGPDLEYNGSYDAFVAKVNPHGTGLSYCSYLGGDGYEVGHGIAIDHKKRGHIYVTGCAGSDETTFPVIIGPDLTHNSSPSDDAFVAKFERFQPWYVDCNALGPIHDGLTWETAFLTIQEALDAAINGDSIFVAEGLYVENIDFLGKAVSICSDVDLNVTTHDPSPETTIIDGGNPSNPDYGSVVAFKNGEGLDSILEGFTLRNGTGTSLSDPPNPGIYGGGVLCYYSSPTVLNNIIDGNSSTRGGGISCYYSSANIEENSILNNNAVYGAGICCYQSSIPIIQNNHIKDNIAEDSGGGIRVNHDTEAEILNNIVCNNIAQGDGGGGIWCSRYHGIISSNLICNNEVSIISGNGDGGGIQLDFNSEPEVVNNFICFNSAPGDGGGIACSNNNPILMNNTIYGNMANQGGGIYCRTGQIPVITNSIIWNNQASVGPQINYSGSPIVNYCDVEGGWQGLNIDEDPMLKDPDGPDNDPSTCDDNDFHLTWASACCINRGLKDNAPSEDIDGDSRPYMSAVDMGADEYTGIHRLEIDSFTISVSAGGVITYNLLAETTNAYRKYVMLGCVTGTIPGFPLPGGNATLPLNWDIFTEYIVIPLINTPIFENFLGTLDENGEGLAHLNIAANLLPPSTVGIVMYYAYCLRWPWEFVSNPVVIEIIP